MIKIKMSKMTDEYLKIPHPSLEMETALRTCNREIPAPTTIQKNKKFKWEIL